MEQLQIQQGNLHQVFDNGQFGRWWRIAVDGDPGCAGGDLANAL